jgi:hypothetical protein
MTMVRSRMTKTSATAVMGSKFRGIRVITGSFLVVTAQSLSRDFIDELLASMLLTIASNMSTFSKRKPW